MFDELVAPTIYDGIAPRAGVTKDAVERQWSPLDFYKESLHF